MCGHTDKPLSEAPCTKGGRKGSEGMHYDEDYNSKVEHGENITVKCYLVVLCCVGCVFCAGANVSRTKQVLGISLLFVFNCSRLTDLKWVGCIRQTAALLYDSLCFKNAVNNPGINHSHTIPRRRLVVFDN